jgi:hypothetical protein
VFIVSDNNRSLRLVYDLDVVHVNDMKRVTWNRVVRQSSCSACLYPPCTTSAMHHVRKCLRNQDAPLMLRGNRVTHVFNLIARLLSRATIVLFFIEFVRLPQGKPIPSVLPFMRSNVTLAEISWSVLNKAHNRWLSARVVWVPVRAVLVTRRPRGSVIPGAVKHN